MPITKKKDGYYWGSRGPFKTRKKAVQVAQAAYASGYVKKSWKQILKKDMSYCVCSGPNKTKGFTCKAHCRSKELKKRQVRTFIITQVEYDTDDYKQDNLETTYQQMAVTANELEIDKDSDREEIEEKILEWISDTTGWLVKNYVYYEVREDGTKIDMSGNIMKAPRIPRKKGQPAKSKKHSDLYTDENPKGTIHGLGFKDVKTAKASVSKIKRSGRSHAHKTQAAIAMEQRAREMGKTSEAAVYRRFIEQQKKKTQERKK